MMFESVLKELWKKYPENKVLEQKLAHCRFIASYFELDEEDQEGIYQAIDDNFDAYVAILKQFPVNRGQWNDLSDELCAFYHDCSNPARFDQIIMHLTVIIESEPNDLAIRALRARYCIKKENWDAALEDLNFCLERMSPDKPSLVSQFAFALYNRAYCYSKKEQWDVAIRDLREAFSLADSSKQSDKIFKLIKDIEDKKKSS
jgi:tetratricopeptide (TPR) repeat protein